MWCFCRTLWHMSVSRRDVLKLAAATPGLLGLGVAAASLCAAPASAALGTLLDYAAGVLPARRDRGGGGGRIDPVCARSRARRKLDAGKADPSYRGARSEQQRAEN